MIDWDKTVIAPLMGAFAEPVSYRTASGWNYEKTISGVFDNAYLKDVMFEDGSTGVSEVQAVLGVQLSQFLFPPAQNDQLLVHSINAYYVVRDVNPDGKGGAKLLLSKVSQW